MLLLDYQNVLIQSILTERFSGYVHAGEYCWMCHRWAHYWFPSLSFSAPPASIDQIVSDFDGVTFHVSTPTSKTLILISLSVKCFRDLLKYGAESVLQREYGPYIVNPEAGYDFSIQVDLEKLPPSPAEREELIMQISLLKRNAMAAPFENAFDQFAQLQEEASRYTSESAPQGVKEGGQVMAIHYREEEAIYIKASHDRVTVIFSTIFRDETDRIFGKVFLQEFVDARRRAIQNAPQVLFRSDPPLELQGVPGPGQAGEKGEVGYITFGQFPQDFFSMRTIFFGEMVMANQLQNSPLPSSSHSPAPCREHLPCPNIQRLLPLSYQSFKSVHPFPYAKEDRRFPSRQVSKLLCASPLFPFAFYRSVARYLGIYHFMFWH